MGNYTQQWNERKKFLLINLIISSVLALGLTIWGVISSIDSIETISDWLLVPVLYIGIDLSLFSCISVIRIVWGKSSFNSFGTNMVAGLWATLMGCFTGGWVTLILGLFLLMVFGFLLAVVILFYMIYLPVSSVYLFIRAKAEHA